MYTHTHTRARIFSLPDLCTHTHVKHSVNCLSRGPRVRSAPAGSSVFIARLATIIHLAEGKKPSTQRVNKFYPLSQGRTTTNKHPNALGLTPPLIPSDVRNSHYNTPSIPYCRNAYDMFLKLHVHIVRIFTIRVLRPTLKIK